jgi:hypothetical protein
LAGTYGVALSGTVTPSPYPAEPLTGATASITLNAPDASGHFTGTYVQDTSTGPIAGNVHANGSINISQFGPAAAVPLEGLAYLQENYSQGNYACNFSSATTGGMSGTVNGAALTLTGGISMPCSWLASGYETYLTAVEFVITFSGNRG